jgi:hypothetical protein
LGYSGWTMYMDGNGVKRDAFKTIEIYKKSCKLVLVMVVTILGLFTRKVKV